MSNSINSQVVTATKWSAITEIASKLISPISTMVLARLLTPEAFGVLVTATMVISFAEIFTDAGFQKYIIQHSFKDDESLYKSTAVAFWSNLIFSLFLWIVICAFSSQIAHLVGNDGYGLVIAISCVCIPLEAFSSIQMALFKRKLDFKTLFIVRIIGIAIPIVITIPLAIVTHSYWSLIIGMIALNVCNAVILTVKSDWKPQWFYDVKLFKDMFSFTIWSMIESITIWLTSYLDVFIVGSALSAHYIGVYRTSINIVGQIMNLVTAATTPVLFSALSKLQDQDTEFKKLFFDFQKMIGMLVIPMGVGIYLFRDLVTEILLGVQWSEAAYMIGWWGLTSAIAIVLSHYCSEIYRSKGKPKYSVLAQIIHLCFLIPTVLISVKYGFQTLCLSRALVRLTAVAINFVLVYFLVRITPMEMMRNVWYTCLASFVMTLIFISLPENSDIFVQFGFIIVCAITYLSVLCVKKEYRSILGKFVRLIIGKKGKKRISGENAIDV